MRDRPAPTRRTLLLDIPAWCAATWLTLLVLLMWSYGANNVALPGLPIPLVDIALIALLVRSRRSWRSFTNEPTGRLLLALLTALAVVVAIRLYIDIPRYGIAAARGALFAVEAWAVLLGAAVARRVGRERTTSLLGASFAIALAWYALFPFRSQLIALSPTVGIRRSTPLFAFTSIGLVGPWCLLWFGLRRTTTAWIGAVVGIVVVLIAQLRGSLAGTIGAIALITLAARRSQRRAGRRLIASIALGVAAGVVVLSIAPTTGRLGAVRLDSYVDLALSAVGQQTSVASSFNDRVEWFETTVETIRTTRLGWLSGVGFGVDLTGGFGIAGSDVVNPHNDLLEFYARLGVFVIAWLAMWVVVLRVFWRRARSGDRLALWGLGAWVTMVAGSLTQPYNSFAYGGMVWWLLAGLVLGSQVTPSSRTIAPQETAGGDPVDLPSSTSR